jgi:YD repeat-containing protein
MIMHGRNTFYWDKHALAVARGDYTKARMRHWLHDRTDFTRTAPVIESVKYPLERRVWFNYPGQFSGGATGDLDKPSRIGRVFDDGTTQLTRLTYNFRGNVESVTDPVGRVTMYEYAPNGIDLVSIKQRTSPAESATIASYTYNDQHRPVTFIDAAGETTQYKYNSAGQVTAITNALNEATQFTYTHSAIYCGLPTRMA